MLLIPVSREGAVGETAAVREDQELRRQGVAGETEGEKAHHHHHPHRRAQDFFSQHWTLLSSPRSLR